MAGAGAACRSIASVASALDGVIGVVRSLVVSIAVIVGVGFGTVVVVKELRQRSLVIEPIQIPEALAGLGYTSENVARQLKEQIGRIHTASTTFKELPLLATSAELPEIEIPETQTSVRQVLSYLRAYVGADEIRFGGEIIGSETVPYTLYLRSSYGPLAAELDPKAELDARQKMTCLLHAAAEQIMAQTEPYVLAVALYASRRPEPARAGARALGQCPLSAAGQDAEPVEARIDRLLAKTLKSGRKEDRPWAYNLRGLLLAENGQLDKAMDAYRAAIEADRNFALAYFNEGHAYAAKAQLESDAEEKSTADFAKAYDLYQKAITLDPDQSYFYAAWGHTLYRAGRYQEASSKYLQALDKDVTTKKFDEELQFRLRVRIVCAQAKIAESKPDDEADNYWNLYDNSLDSLKKNYPTAQIDGLAPDKAFNGIDLCEAEHLDNKLQVDLGSGL
jgi:tetratricopeptide (TPR) repeat protein